MIAIRKIMSVDNDVINCSMNNPITNRFMQTFEFFCCLANSSSVAGND